MIRIPDEGRFEYRLADGAANPYLLQADILAAGLNGIANKSDPGKRLDIDMYAEGYKVKGAPKLPLNMLDALREYDKDKGLKAHFRCAYPEAYAKRRHWVEQNAGGGRPVTRKRDKNVRRRKVC